MGLSFADDDITVPGSRKQILRMMMADVDLQGDMVGYFDVNGIF